MPQYCCRATLKSRVLLFVISSTFFLHVHAQTLEEKIAVESCKCFDKVNLSHTSVAEVIGSLSEGCFGSVLGNHKREILVALNITDTTNAEAGVKVGQILVPAVISGMILHCDKFFHFVDTARWKEFRPMEQDQLQMKLLEVNDKINAGEEEPLHYYQRGMCYFFLGQIDHADVDFRTVIEIDNNPFAYFFVGWIKEIQGDYEGAGIYYQRTIDLLGTNDMRFVLAIVERKLRDQKAGKVK